MMDRPMSPARVADTHVKLMEIRQELVSAGAGLRMVRPDDVDGLAEVAAAARLVAQAVDAIDRVQYGQPDPDRHRTDVVELLRPVVDGPDVTDPYERDRLLALHLLSEVSDAVASVRNRAEGEQVDEVGAARFALNSAAAALERAAPRPPYPPRYDG